MHAERDYLVKQVFPELREWCEMRKLRLVDIDLRWGVTEEDATNHKNVVKVCLDRINECRPFFLCFLGQRRGWVPGKLDISPETCEKYPELKKFVGKASVTEMEIFHAVLNPFNHVEYADNALFYLRDPEYLDDLPLTPTLIRKTFTNEGIANLDEQRIADEELDLWRLEVTIKYPEKVHPYQVSWNKDAQTPELSLPFICPSSDPDNQRMWRETWNSEANLSLPDVCTEIPEEFMGAAKAANERITKGRLGKFESKKISLKDICLQYICPFSIPDNQKKWREMWKNEADISLPDDCTEIPEEFMEAAEAANERIAKGRLGNFRSGKIPLKDIILEDLKNAITHRHPNHVEVTEESPLQKELDQQEQFLELNTLGYIERTGDFDTLDAYLESDSRDLFVLTGKGGMGKTMLLANWIRWCQNTQENLKIYYRFVGGSDGSSTVDGVLRSIVTEMGEDGIFSEEIPDDP
jgi:hypothetical protein